MASIKKHEDGIVVRWDKDDWMRGLMPFYGAGTDTRPGDGMANNVAVDPFRRYGFLSPGYTSQDATNSDEIDAILKNGVVVGNKAYCIEGGAKLHEVSAALVTPSVSNTGSWSHTITGTGVVGEDVAVFTVSGTRYVFYTWNDNTDGDMGSLITTGPTFDRS